MTDDMHREAFERQAKKYCFPLATDNEGEQYVNSQTELYWNGWCAAIRHMREQEDKA